MCLFIHTSNRNAQQSRIKRIERSHAIKMGATPGQLSPTSTISGEILGITGIMRISKSHQAECCTCGMSDGIPSAAWWNPEFAWGWHLQFDRSHPDNGPLSSLHHPILVLWRGTACTRLTSQGYRAPDSWATCREEAAQLITRTRWCTAPSLLPNVGSPEVAQLVLG